VDVSEHLTRGGKDTTCVYDLWWWCSCLFRQAGVGLKQSPMPRFALWSICERHHSPHRFHCRWAGSNFPLSSIFEDATDGSRPIKGVAEYRSKTVISNVKVLAHTRPPTRTDN